MVRALAALSPELLFPLAAPYFFKFLMYLTQAHATYLRGVAANPLIEVACHGYLHEDFALQTLAAQTALLQQWYARTAPSNVERDGPERTRDR
jgi:hypothetical protein